MKVFVGFGYNANDKWIEEVMLPFIETMGCEVQTGEEMQGENLAQGVIDRIKDSDVCIGFLTRRGNANQEGIFQTHSWVISELATALTLKKPVFEIREKGIDPQKGMLGDRQRYEFEDKLFLMLEVAKFINKEKAKFSAKIFMLLPPEFSEAIRPNAKFAKCKYTFLHKSKLYEPEETNLIKMQGGYGIIIRQIPSEEAQIEITVEAPGMPNWSSGYVSVGTKDVKLEKD